MEEDRRKYIEHHVPLRTWCIRRDNLPSSHSSGPPTRRPKDILAAPISTGLLLLYRVQVDLFCRRDGTLCRANPRRQRVLPRDVRPRDRAHKQPCEVVEPQGLSAGEAVLSRFT